MYFKQFYLGCLAQASYMIGSRGEAAVVDPRRDVEMYIEQQGFGHITNVIGGMTAWNSARFEAVA